MAKELWVVVDGDLDGAVIGPMTKTEAIKLRDSFETSSHPAHLNCIRHDIFRLMTPRQFTIQIIKPYEEAERD